MTSRDNKELRPCPCPDGREDCMVNHQERIQKERQRAMCTHLFNCPNCVEFGKFADSEIETLKAERDSLKLRYQELEEQTGKTGAERLRLLDEIEKLNSELGVQDAELIVTKAELFRTQDLCDELAEALKTIITPMSSFQAFNDGRNYYEEASDVLEKYTALRGDSQNDVRGEVKK
jgi:hypothetical protein